MALSNNETQEIKDQVERINELLLHYKDLLLKMHFVIGAAHVTNLVNYAGTSLSSFQASMSGVSSQEDQTLYTLMNNPVEVIMIGLHKSALLGFIENTDNNIKNIIIALNNPSFSTEGGLRNANKLLVRALEDCKRHETAILGCAHNDIFAPFVSWVKSIAASIRRMFEDVKDAVSVLGKKSLPNTVERDNVVKQTLSKNKQSWIKTSYETSIKRNLSHIAAECTTLKTIIPKT